ncbi:hypothetical protein Q7P37_008954 [Cladosporium fusiforme]
MAVGRPRPARAAGGSGGFALTGGQQAAMIPRPLPIVGEGEDDDDVDYRRRATVAATQPPSSSSTVHALQGLFANGAAGRARTRSPELERGVACSLAGGPNVPRDDAKPKQRSPATSISSLSTRTTSSHDTIGTNTITTASTPGTASTSLGASPTDSSAYNPIRVLTGAIDRNALPDQGWMLDLELMHHFTASCSEIMTEHFDLLETMWQIEMPRIAIRSQYVMHALLGFSALHLASLQPERAHLLRACATNHLDKALVLYRQDSGPATAENADARFTFTWFVAMFAFAIPSSVPPIDAMVELFSLVRGIEIVLQESLMWIIQGPFAPILTRTFIESRGLADDGTALSMAFAFQASSSHTGGVGCLGGGESLPDGMDFGLNHLDFMIGMHSMVPEERRTCVLILSELKQLYAQVLGSQGSCGMSMIMCFPKQDPSHFSRLLKRRNPQALVILAYYTVLLDLLDSRWWVHGWGRRVLRDVVGSLGDEWKSWIEWPVQTVLMKQVHQVSLSPVVVSLDATML